MAAISDLLSSQNQLFRELDVLERELYETAVSSKEYLFILSEIIDIKKQLQMIHLTIYGFLHHENSDVHTPPDYHL